MTNPVSKTLSTFADFSMGVVALVVLTGWVRGYPSMSSHPVWEQVVVDVGCVNFAVLLVVAFILDKRYLRRQRSGS